MTAADQPTTEPSAEVHARAMVVSRVLREHEPRPMACSCGTPLGDSIDSRWHLANQVAAAVAAALAPAPQPAADAVLATWTPAEVAASPVGASRLIQRLDAVVTAVRRLADRWERGATRWENPLPVPDEVHQLRRALDGGAS